MRIMSDTITSSVLYQALADIKPLAPSVCFDGVSTVKGRTHAHSHTVYLEGYGARHTRASNGRDGMAATWMDWGWLIAGLLAYDPEARVGHYTGWDSFLDITKRDVEYRLHRDPNVKNFARDYAAIWPNSHSGDRPSGENTSPFALVDTVLPDRALRAWDLPRVEQFLA